MVETEPLEVKARDNEIIITVGDFCAVYFKPPRQPQLILRSRTETDDYELLAQVWQAAVRRRASWGGLSSAVSTGARSAPGLFSSVIANSSNLICHACDRHWR